MRYTRIALAFLLAACFLVAAVVAGQQTDGTTDPGQAGQQAGGTPEPGQSGQPAANTRAGEDPEQNALNEREASLAARTRQLVNDYAKATGEDARAKIKDELAAVVKEHFQLRQALREQELADLEEQVKRLRGLLDKRHEAQQSIIDTRLNQLLHPSEGLGWDEGQGEQPTATSAIAAGGASANRKPVEIAIPWGGKLDIEGAVYDVWENDLVEITLGADDGVRRGDRLFVHSGHGLKNTVEVITVYPKRAIARINDRSVPIQSGERVGMPSRTIEEIIEGNWRVISVESEGEELPEEDLSSSRAFTFARGNFFIGNSRLTRQGGAYVLDAKQQRIVFQPSGQEVFFGRYAFEGDRLLLAISNQTTPADVASPPGSDVRVYKLERIPEGTREADPAAAGKAGKRRPRAN